MTDKQLQLSKDYFLPYQVDWIKSENRFKLWDKSRRIGATYTESYAACRRRNRIKNRRDYWFSSADESAAIEFALYCADWCKLMKAIVECVTDVREDDDGTKYNNYRVTYPNGSRINCMSSNPKRFRSKGGDVCLDEFDFHDDPGKMYDAASPVTMWGYDMCIMTTRNGEGSDFDKLVNKVRKVQNGEATAKQLKILDWEYFFTPITVAVEQGLAEKIRKLDRPCEMTRQEFIEECEAKSRNHDAFLQEYMCIPSASASALIPYALYESCQRDGILGNFTGGGVYVGIDIGREHNPTVVWAVENIGGMRITRDVFRMYKTPFPEQKKAIKEKLRSYPNLVRACVDATGMGLGITEDLQRMFGEYMVEKCIFTAPFKEITANRVKNNMEDKTLIVPNDVTSRDSFHAVRKIVSAGGKERYDAANTGDDHADDFWAAALAEEAAATNVKPEVMFI